MSAQGSEGEVLQRLFAEIGTTNKFAVEFGAKDGVRGSNTWRFRVNHRWTCLLVDANPGSPLVHRAFLTAENIERLFARWGVPAAFDLLSIDVDGNDFWLWRALTSYAPRVVVIEYNSRFGPDESLVMPYRPDHRWDRTDYYGASAAALVKLGRAKGYALVEYTARTNLFFVREEVLAGVGLGPCPVPPADPYGYPVTDRPWESH